MSLPAGQQRALNRIEKNLADDDFGLGPLFAIFTSLAGKGRARAQLPPSSRRTCSQPRPSGSLPARPSKPGRDSSAVADPSLSAPPPLRLLS
jgi:hypothetical protein